MMKAILLAVVLAAAAITVIGCHTVEGFGQDVQWTGEKIQGQ